MLYLARVAMSLIELINPFVQCHSGIMGGGHYISYAKNPNGKWLYYNDSTCKVLHSRSLTYTLIFHFFPLRYHLVS